MTAKHIEPHNPGFNKHDGNSDQIAHFKWLQIIWNDKAAIPQHTI